MNPHSFFLQLIQKDFSEFEDFLARSSDEEVRQLLAELHPADIADIVENVKEENKGRIMALLDTQLAAEVLSFIDEYHAPKVIEAIPEDTLPKIIDEMASDDATDLLEELPAEEAAEILDAMPKEESAPVRKLLSYPPDTAGGLMQTELVAVPPEATLSEAVEKVRELVPRAGEIISVYVVNPEGKLQGVVPMRSLILEPSSRRVGDVMLPDVISVQVDMDQEEVAALFRKYDFLVLPVVDKENKLLGRILVDDIVDVIEEEASEDIYRLAGVDKEEHVDDSPARSIRLRLPWLTFNLLTAILAASVVSFFQGTIQKLVILAVFMPIVAGMGGNAGTQSLAVITRAIALGEVTLANAYGVILGVLMAGLAYFYEGSPMLGLVLGMAMVCNMFVAALAGTAIPIILKWLKVDPALASGVIVTTFTDVAGFFSFLGLATLFIHYLI
jgi:magnesium transporter